MQFQVPQFIEVEDKIFGPLTLKQAIYIGGGGGLSFLLWKYLPHIIALPLVGIVVGFSVALAFFKINNRPFIVMLEAALNYLLRPRLYLWRPDVVRSRRKKTSTSSAPTSHVSIPNLSERKLQQLAWSLDIKETLPQERARAGHTPATQTLARQLEQESHRITAELLTPRNSL